MKNSKNFKKNKVPLIFKKRLNEHYFMLHSHEEKNKTYTTYYTGLMLFFLLNFLLIILVLLKIMIYFLDKDLFDILIEN